jgi:hypothetical protein
MNVLPRVRAGTCAAMLFVVPLTGGDGWHVLTYRNIPANTVRYGEQGLQIEVMGSASPVIYRLQAPLLVNRVRARGRIEGALNVRGDMQGRQGFDDYALRIGLVEGGQRRLGFFERQLAPAWVRTLFNLAPADTGISQVRFFNLGVDSRQIGISRRHPLSNLLHEEVVASPASDGTFELSISFRRPINTLALWISADGDDTKSAYAVSLQALELDTQEID